MSNIEKIRFDGLENCLKRTFLASKNEHFRRQNRSKNCQIVSPMCSKIAGYTNGVEIHWNVNMDLQKHVLSKNRSCQEWSDFWERDAEKHGLSPKSGGASTRNTGQVLGKWRYSIQLAMQGQKWRFKSVFLAAKKPPNLKWKWFRKVSPPI